MSDMTIEELEIQIAEIDGRIGGLKDRRHGLRRTLTHLKSIAFIKANGVKLEDVELSRRDDGPYFGEVWKFSRWLANKKDRKRFCEWNESIYFTEEIIAGRMAGDTLATMSALKEYESEAVKS